MFPLGLSKKAFDRNKEEACCKVSHKKRCRVWVQGVGQEQAAKRNSPRPFTCRHVSCDRKMSSRKWAMGLTLNEQLNLTGWPSMWPPEQVASCATRPKPQLDLCVTRQI